MPPQRLLQLLIPTCDDEDELILIMLQFNRSRLAQLSLRLPCAVSSVRGDDSAISRIAHTRSHPHLNQ